MLGRTTTEPTVDLSPASPAALQVAIVLDTETAALLDAPQLSLPDITVKVHDGSLASFMANGPMLRSTDVLICQINPDNPRDFETFERFVRDNVGRLPVVAAVRDLTVATTRRILRSEAVDVLPIPFSQDELYQAIETGREAIVRDRPASQSRGGRIISFFGALGGVGTTSIMAQAGMAWADSKRVCVIDLDVQFGNAALYVNLKPQLCLVDLIDAGDRLDTEILQSVAAQHVSGMSIIACPADIMPLDVVTPEFVEKLLDLAVENYDIVLVDLPNAWVNWTLSAFQRSDAICLVTELSVPGVHQAKRQIDLIEANGLGERLRVVMNRVAAPLFGRSDVSGPQAALRRKIDFTIVNDYLTVSAALNEGKTLAGIKVKSRVERDIRYIIKALTTMIAIEANVR